MSRHSQKFVPKTLAHGFHHYHPFREVERQPREHIDPTKVFGAFVGSHVGFPFRLRFHFDHRFRDAFRARSLRSAGVMFAADAFPPREAISAIVRGFAGGSVGIGTLS